MAARLPTLQLATGWRLPLAAAGALPLSARSASPAAPALSPDPQPSPQLLGASIASSLASLALPQAEKRAQDGLTAGFDGQRGACVGPRDARRPAAAAAAATGKRWHGVLDAAWRPAGRAGGHGHERAVAQLPQLPAQPAAGPRVPQPVQPGPEPDVPQPQRVRHGRESRCELLFQVGNERPR